MTEGEASRASGTAAFLSSFGRRELELRSKQRKAFMTMYAFELLSVMVPLNDSSPFVSF